MNSERFLEWSREVTTKEWAFYFVSDYNKGIFSSTKGVLKVWSRITLRLFILLFVFVFSYIVRWRKWKGELPWRNIVKDTETDPATVFQSTVCAEIRHYGISEMPNTDQGKTNCGVLDDSRCVLSWINPCWACGTKIMSLKSSWAREWVQGQLEKLSNTMSLKSKRSDIS